MRKKHQIIMLATDAKVDKGQWCLNVDPNNKLAHGTKVQEPYNMSENNQHLYILSDEEIKEGDWMIRDFDYAIIKDNVNSDNRKGEKFHKIIATTNPELSMCSKSPKDRHLDCNGTASIPTDFIERYVKEWNKGNVIKEVMLEYEVVPNEFDNPMSNPEGIETSDSEYELKLRPNNTVIIHPVEERRFSKNDLKFAYITYNTRGDDEGFDEWFNENYPE